MIDAPPNEIEDDSFTFQLKHEFPMLISEMLSKYQDDKLKEAMLFVGFFKNEKNLFGWLAVPLFNQDTVT